MVTSVVAIPMGPGICAGPTVAQAAEVRSGQSVRGSGRGPLSYFSLIVLTTSYPSYGGTAIALEFLRRLAFLQHLGAFP